MRIFDRLMNKQEKQEYNPDDDPLIIERISIGFRAERVSKIAEDVQQRASWGRFPILMDEHVEKPRW